MALPYLQYFFSSKDCISRGRSLTCNVGSFDLFQGLSRGRGLWRNLTFSRVNHLLKKIKRTTPQSIHLPIWGITNLIVVYITPVHRTGPRAHSSMGN